MSETYELPDEPEPETAPSEFEREEADEMAEAEKRDEPQREHG